MTLSIGPADTSLLRCGSVLAIRPGWRGCLLEHLGARAFHMRVEDLLHTSKRVPEDDEVQDVGSP